MQVRWIEVALIFGLKVVQEGISKIDPIPHGCPIDFCSGWGAKIGRKSVY